MKLAAAAVMLVLAGCSQAPPPQQQPTLNSPVTATLEAMEADSVAEIQIDLLLNSERSLVEPDSFLATGAIVLADGELRNSAPRLAGVGLGGAIQLISSRVSVVGSFVWAILEYRWLPMFENDTIRFGVATLIIGRARDGEWRVLHMHSSSERPLPEPQKPESPDTTSGTPALLQSEISSVG
jgi:hypothetical protein